ncbi:15901_t:CDS:2 [Funneliformis mosseae]|uniref:15901_t:CDS:1 n=1 Tax=Funneliformis mosseae TaxID=27381 RepID=A0A9N9A444_FUNMO|nr:15901_t:CDS:2 [Funneliformis mosseae]
MSQYTIVVLQHDQPPNNWPSFYPIIYHNLEDFPVRDKTLLKRSYILFKLYVIGLFVDLCVDVTVMMMTDSASSSELMDSFIPLITILFGDFFGRHLSLYLAIK